MNLTAHPTDPDEIVFHVFDSIIPISLAVGSKILRLALSTIASCDSSISAAAPAFRDW